VTVLKKNRAVLGTSAVLSSIGVLTFTASAAFAVDPATIAWAKVPATNLTLFYPGQSTYQWLRSTDHAGAQGVTSGTACVACHKGQENQKGASLVKAGKLEPIGLGSKDGVKQLNMQVAYDEEYAYFRFQWRTKNAQPGDAYPTYRFDGKEWKPFGGPRLTKKIASGEEPAVYEDRFSMMIDDGRVAGFATQGCWLTCHDGERDSRKQPSADEVKAAAFYQAIKKNDVRKYLPKTRTDADASWDKGVSMDELAQLKASGYFLDLVQWRAHRSNPVGMADDGYVLEWRNFDAGRSPFSSNMDPKTKQPLFMYDAAKFGKKALAVADINRTGTTLLKRQNAVAFDPNAGWKEGDLLPQYVVSREDATGSAADNKQVKGVWNDGVWTVTWARPLNLANADDKALKEGNAYNFAFAVHDDNITTRGHHISFPMTIGFGTKGDIQAVKLRQIHQ
jgi:hypothetical protein